VPAASPLDADRLWADIMALAEITEPDRPYTRRSFSPLFLEGRRWLADRFADAGLATRIDAAGIRWKSSIFLPKSRAILAYPASAAAAWPARLRHECWI
jgi:hypothetical protein